MRGQRLLGRLKEELSILRGNLLVLVVSWIFLYFAYAIVHPYESLYLQALGASPFIIGLISSLGTALLCLSRIPGAYIADRYGRKKIIATMTYGLVFAYALLAVAPDWRLAAVAIALCNLCMVYQPALEAITADSIPPERRGTGYALANVLPSAPSILAPLVARALVDRYGFVPGVRIAYWLVVALCLAAATVRALWLEETLETGGEARPREVLAELKRSAAEVAAAIRRLPRPLAALTAVLIIDEFGGAMVRAFMPLYAVNVAGVSKPDWALLDMVWTAVVLAAGLPLGRLVDAAGRRRALLASQTIHMLAMICFVRCRGFPGMVVVMVMLALSSALFLPAYQALLADMTPRAMRGRVMGGVGTLTRIAMIPGSALGGLLYEVAPASPFLLCALLDAICALITIQLIEEPSRREA